MARRSSIWAVETAVSGSALSFKYHAEFCSKKRRCSMEHVALWGERREICRSALLFCGAIDRQWML